MRKALVLSLAMVLGLGIAAFAQGELTGEWDMNVYITPNAADIASFLDFDTALTVTYTVGGWAFTSYTEIDDTGWTTQSFDAAGAFGAFTVASGLIFGTDATFYAWTLDTSFTFGAVALAFDFDLYDSDIRLVVTGTATTGLVDITVAVTFGDLIINSDGSYTSNDDECDLDWQGVSITVDFPFCCADVTATLDITCAGFQEACFAVSGIAIPNLPWVTLDAEVCFILETKTLTLTPNFDFGADVCFDLYICEDYDGGLAPNHGALRLGDFYIAGIGLVCEIGGVSFTGISYWGDECALKPSALGDYWEMYKIATTEDACCGPFDFDIAVFFEEGGAALFDVAAFEANFSYELGDNFTFSMGFDYTVGVPGLSKWTIGFTVTW
jgi:hypothetical protein